MKRLVVARNSRWSGYTRELRRKQRGVWRGKNRKIARRESRVKEVGKLDKK